MEVMDILKVLFGITTTFFTAAAILVFLHCFYDTGYRWTRKKAILILVLSVVYELVTILTKNELIASMILLVPEFFIITYDYPGKKWRGYWGYVVINLSFVIALSSIADIGALLTHPGSDYDYFASFSTMDPAELAETTDVMAVWGSIQVPDSVYLFIYILGTVFLGLVFCGIYFSLYRRGIVMQYQKRERWFLIIYPVICLGLDIVFTYLGKESKITLIILAVLSLLLALLIPVFVFFSRVSQHYRERVAYQEDHMQAQLTHFNQYKQTHAETVRFRHDIRNNLLCLNEMLQAEKTEEAIQYLQDMVNTAEALRQKYVSGDEMLDCIIGVKAGTMEENGIQFRLEGVMAGGLPWKPIDVCNVFANALDNAIEACQQLPPEDRNITMTIKSTDSFWFIAIENPVLKDVDTQKLFQKTGGFSSKANAEQHGIGTYNMKDTVESNGGILKATCQNKLFTLEIMIDKT